MSYISSNRQGLSGSSLRFIAIFSMIVDHGGYFLVGRFIKKAMLGAGFSITDENMRIWASLCQSNQVLSFAYHFTRYFGRIAFPLFVFLLAEGYWHTGSRIKYFLRLAVLAVVSEIPFNLAVSQKVWHPMDQNVIFTFLLGFAGVSAYEYIRDNLKDKKIWHVLSRLSYPVSGGVLAYLFMKGIFGELNVSKAAMDNTSIIAVVLACALASFGLSFIFVKSTDYTLGISLLPVMAASVIASLIKSDYGGYGVISVFLMIVFRNRGLWGAILGCLCLVLFRSNELFGLLALVPIYFYNGKKGTNGRYIYYLVYPVQYILFYFLNL